MKHSCKRSRRDERGQALVEFALLLPVILLLVVGMLEFARAWNLHQVMTDAVREGARRAAIHDVGQPNAQNVDSVYAAMWRYLAQAGYKPQYATMGLTSSGGVWKKTGDNVTVTLSLPYRFAILPTRPLTMRSTFTMRYE
jgi:Flp pilus assembly protein TadG